MFWSFWSLLSNYYKLISMAHEQKSQPVPLARVSWIHYRFHFLKLAEDLGRSAEV